MAVSENLTAYSTTASSNTPAGSDAVGTDLDDHIRDIKKNIRNASNVAVVALKAAAYATVLTDHCKLIQFDCSASAQTCSLLAAATAGDGYKVAIKRAKGANIVLIDGNSAETINGSSTKSLTASGQIVTLISDGSNYHILSEHLPQALVADSSPTLTGTWAFGGGAAGTDWELIDTCSDGSLSSGVCEIKTNITSTYRQIKIFLSGLIPGTDDVSLLLRVSEDAGSSYASGATVYSWAYIGQRAGGTGEITNDDNSDSAIAIVSSTASLGTAANEDYSGEITMYNHADTGHPTQFVWTSSHKRATDSNITILNGAGMYNSDAAVNALKLSLSTGSISNIEMRAYGLRDT